MGYPVSFFLTRPEDLLPFRFLFGNQIVLHVPNFSSDLKIVNYDNKGTEERKCFSSVSLFDRHKKDGTVIVSFYSKCYVISFQIKSEIPQDWSMHD